MFGTSPSLPLVPFRIVTKPSAGELGWEDSTSSVAVFLLSFGVDTASHLVKDAWKGCCELYLQSQLARHDKLHSFSLEGENLFAVTHIRDTMVCSWSNRHIFAVQKAEFVGQAEALVEQVLAAVSADRAEQFVRLGASMIRKDTRFARLIQPSSREDLLGKSASVAGRRSLSSRLPLVG
jgi:hypothetical protein